MIQQTIKRVFKHYKKAYNLTTKLRFRLKKELLGCVFKSNKNTIYFAFPPLSYYYTEKQKRQESLFAILHEIGHAIDYKYNKEQMEQERKNTNRFLYTTNSNYWRNLPFEKRANNFAEKEITKWEGFEEK